MKKYIEKILNEGVDPDIEILKKSIKEEKDAIVLYTKFMNQSSCKRVKAMMAHVIEEEQHHADEFEELMKTKIEENQ